MAGRKQAVGVQAIAAHTRQDAGISKGSPDTRRFYRSRSNSGFVRPSQCLATRIPHLDFSLPAIKNSWEMPMRVKTARNTSPGNLGPDRRIGPFRLPRGLSLR